MPGEREKKDFLQLSDKVMDIISVFLKNFLYI